MPGSDNLDEPQSPLRRLFVAHPKSLAQEALDDLVADVRRCFEGRVLASGVPFRLQVTTGREAATEWAKGRDGLPFNWNAWIDYVTGGVSPFGGEPRFHYYVVGPSQIVGRGTAPIVRRALAKRRSVLYVEKEVEVETGKVLSQTLRKVTAVVAANENNWKAGWYVSLG